MGLTSLKNHERALYAVQHIADKCDFPLCLGMLPQKGCQYWFGALPGGWL